MSAKSHQLKIILILIKQISIYFCNSNKARLILKNKIETDVSEAKKHISFYVDRVHLHILFLSISMFQFMVVH